MFADCLPTTLQSYKDGGVPGVQQPTPLLKRKPILGGDTGSLARLRAGTTRVTEPFPAELTSTQLTHPNWGPEQFNPSQPLS